jgi:hypothetical protein
MARPQEIDYIWHASNDRAALAVNILFFIKCALLVKAETTETTELRVNLKIPRLSVRREQIFLRAARKLMRSPGIFFTTRAEEVDLLQHDEFMQQNCCEGIQCVFAR